MGVLILQEREKYGLGNPESFHYLNQSKCYKLDGVSDAEEYLATRRAMDIVGISEDEQVVLPYKTPYKCAHQFHSQHYISCVNLINSNGFLSFQEAIFRVVAAILHLGNIEFSKGKEFDSSVIKDEKSRFHLNTTAELLK